MEYPLALKNLIESFCSLPSIGKKTAERLALYVLTSLDEDSIVRFSDSLKSVKQLNFCPICHNISEDDNLCTICDDSNRDKSQVMVVENIKDVFILEKMQEYKGVYHVLNGSINFANGVGIEDINVNSLINRVKDGVVNEVILATNATVEGETTARYIKVMLEDFDINVTRIAHGLPVGGDIGYADEMTLLKAVEGRRKY